MKKNSFKVNYKIRGSLNREFEKVHTMNENCTVDNAIWSHQVRRNAMYNVSLLIVNTLTINEGTMIRERERKGLCNWAWKLVHIVYYSILTYCVDKRLSTSVVDGIFFSLRTYVFVFCYLLFSFFFLSLHYIKI